MGDIFETTKAQGLFTQMEYADALFFQAGLAPVTIRVQAPSIAKVFTDGVPLGADLEGFLFFSDINDLTTAAYAMSEARDPKDLKYYAKVEFYKGFSRTPYAVFLASDPHRIAHTLLNNQASLSGGGQWSKLDIGCSTALLEKQGASSVVTITAPSIRKKATFQAANHFAAATFSVQGNLAFEALSQISGGTIAGSALDDRIYFSSGSVTDFKAFFMPFTDAGRIGLQRNTNLGAVTWSAI